MLVDSGDTTSSVHGLTMLPDPFPPLPDPSGSREERLDDLYRILRHGTMDLLNSLVTVDGFGELLEMRNYAGQEYLNEIRKSAKQAIELVHYIVRATHAVGDTLEYEAWSNAFYQPDRIQHECISDEPSLTIAPALSPRVP
jgi:hypothetical protein